MSFNWKIQIFEYVLMKNELRTCIDKYSDYHFLTEKWDIPEKASHAKIHIIFKFAKKNLMELNLFRSF